MMKYALYFIIGGTVVSVSTWAGSLGRSWLAAFVSTFPALTVLTFILIYQCGRGAHRPVRQEPPVLRAPVDGVCRILHPDGQPLRLLARPTRGSLRRNRRRDQARLLDRPGGLRHFPRFAIIPADYEPVPRREHRWRAGCQRRSCGDHPPGPGRKGTRPRAAALIAEVAGADGIVVHLREDRRHIQPRDLRILRESSRQARPGDGRHGRDGPHRHRG